MRSRILHFVNDIHLIELPCHEHDNGELIVMEAGHKVPMDIRRVFVVRGRQGVVRGHHAHQRLTQFFVCVNGVCQVTCHDGKDIFVARLDRLDVGLHIPPGIWAEQVYEAPDTVLMVACDRQYEEDDYIRHFPDFLRYRREMAAVVGMTQYDFR